MRRVVPYLLVPLGLLASGLASAPWLRAYPAAVLAVPLFGAAALSVLLPVAVVGLGLRRLWASAVVDLAGYLLFTTGVGLRAPLDLAALWSGIVDGPSQILTFALPLVSPGTLLVAPLTLAWIAGAVLGECLARAWHSVLPYATLLVCFALAYAASVRGVTSTADGRRYDTLLGGALLLVLLLTRAAQAWLEQDLDSDATGSDGVLPLRGLGLGALAAIALTLVVSVVAESSSLAGPPATAQRRPPLARGDALNPLAFVAGLRPADPTRAGRELFRVTVDRRTSGYVAIADVDYYDGDGWTFARTFRPSGGEVAGESDPLLRARGAEVTQRYTISAGPLAGSPWLPFLYRARRVTGTPVDVDTASGMIVPAGSLRAGARYTVRSAVSDTSFASLPASAPVATSTPPDYSAVPAAVGSSMSPVVAAFEKETGVQASTPVPFLQALVADLRAHYSLAGGRRAPGTSSAPPAPAKSFAAGRPTSSRSPSPSPSASPTSSSSSPASSGGTGFANVLTSILGAGRSGTPEQYATLVALVARQVGVPARVVSGFRVGNRASIAPGSYRVTSGEAWTWVEVPVDGRGWMVLDPTPSLNSSDRAPSTSPRPRASPTPTPSRTPNGLVTRSNRQGNAVAPKSSIPGGSTAGPSLLLILLVVAGAVVVALLLGLVLRKPLRARRRRRTGDPRRRLLGAWQEALDMLSEAGLADLRALSGAEVAAATRARFGDAPAACAQRLGEQANEALFSPTSWIGPAEALDSWRSEAALRRGVRSRMTAAQRARAALRYRRPARPTAPTGPSSWASLARARSLADRPRRPRRRRSRHAR